MIREDNGLFVLETKNTLYCFEKMASGHLEHLYYGKKFSADSLNCNALREKRAFGPGNTIAYSKDFLQLSLEDTRLEMSSRGKGDLRTPFVEITRADGSFTNDFIFESFTIDNVKQDLGLLPGSYDESGEYQHLCITLKDFSYDIKMELHYTVYEDCDIITRSSKVINESSEAITINRLMSAQLDLDDSNYIITSFHGAWAREMKKYDMELHGGTFVNSTTAGVSSNRANPFVMLSRKSSDDFHGDCFAFNLIYSGNHAEIFDVNSFDKMRFVTGINPEGFSFKVEAGETFSSPEAVMSFSSNGKNSLSHNMHDFVNQHIVRGEWKGKNRPILLNSWEAAYFKINEKKLVDLAKEAKNVGIELLVMDDGWFGSRDDDTSSLGDWEVNVKKLPGGLMGLCEKVKAQGLMFGLWVEPEMVNVNSNLYREHPDWAMEIPGKPHSEGRNQRILDLTKLEVCNYLVDTMTTVFKSADLSYVKWDMNRVFSDVFSTSLPADRQGEVAHRYVLGLYYIMDKLTKKFPKILFEGCSSGGNRFDLGILSFFPQIWASDDTDAFERVSIQNSYSYGYPQSTVTAHVSGTPNHQTLRNSPLDTRFNVAFFGNLGYEFNLCNLSSDDKEALKLQVSLYKQWREVMQWGYFNRSRSFDDGRFFEWTCVSKDKKKAVGLLMQNRVIPNMPGKKFYAAGLAPEYNYRFYNISGKVDIRLFGDLVNMMSPVTLKQDSKMLDIAAKFIKMDGEKEEYTAPGQLLMDAGVFLKQTFAGTGFSDQVAYYQDLGSRLYFMEAID